MTTTATPPGLAWRHATIREIRQETPAARTLVLDVPDWPGHLAGQHVDVRLPPGEADRTERTFSIASPPEDPMISLTIAKLPGGGVSQRLCGDVRPGYEFEVRGPKGRTFVWRSSDRSPLQLIAGGSGIVPLMAMLRHRARSGSRAGARLLYSSRRWSEVIYRDELAALAESDATLELTHTITGDAPPGWSGFSRRVDGAMLEAVAWPPSAQPHIYVCGSATFVHSTAAAMVALGHDRASILVEGFGPTGGK